MPVELIGIRDIPSVELKDRELVELGEPHPLNRAHGIRHIAVAITVEEAQEFIAKDWRVYGDDEGPYLVIRIPAKFGTLFVTSRDSVDVTFKPVPWKLRDTHSGVICWLERII